MKSIREMSGRLHEFMIALEKAGFTPEHIQQIISASGNKIALGMFNAVFDGKGQKPILGIENARFHLIYESEKMEPMRFYDSEVETYIEQMYGVTFKQGDYFGGIYGTKVRVYSIDRGGAHITRKTLEEIQHFATQQRGILPGLRGLAEADYLLGLSLPKDQIIFGLGPVNRMRTNNEVIQIPFLHLETLGCKIERGWLDEGIHQSAACFVLFVPQN